MLCQSICHPPQTLVRTHSWNSNNNINSRRTNQVAPFNGAVITQDTSINKAPHRCLLLRCWDNCMRIVKVWFGPLLVHGQAVVSIQVIRLWSHQMIFDLTKSLFPVSRHNTIKCTTNSPWQRVLLRHPIHHLTPSSPKTKWRIYKSCIRLRILFICRRNGIPKCNDATLVGLPTWLFLTPRQTTWRQQRGAIIRKLWLHFLRLFGTIGIITSTFAIETSSVFGCGGNAS